MTFRSILDGALAGLAATAPMSFFMEAASRLAPNAEQARLPPRQITQAVGRHARIWRQMNETERQAATLLAHFAFGAAAGAAYGALVPRSASSGWLGRLFGLAVWSTFYVEVLPALGLRRSALHDPWWRTGTMIASHFVWGAALGRALDKRQPAAALGFTGAQRTSALDDRLTARAR